MIAPDAAAGSPDRYVNAEWEISEFGMEHRHSGYTIERAVLGARRHGGLWEWPLHLAEKSWCSPGAFREAFLVALDLFGIERDADLAKSFAIGIASNGGSNRVSRAEAVRLGELVAPRAIGRRRFVREEAHVSARSAPAGDLRQAEKVTG